MASDTSAHVPAPLPQVLGESALSNSFLGNLIEVCIVARDYLCISLNASKGGKEKSRKEEEKPDKEVKAGSSSGSFILILRRQREK